MYSNSNPIDGLPSKENRKLSKEEKKALKQKKKDDAKKQKEEEKRKKEELKRKEKEEKEEKKRRDKDATAGGKKGSEKRKSVKDLDAQTIAKQGSSNSLSLGSGESNAVAESPRGGLSSSQSSIDKRGRDTVSSNGGGNTTPKLTRTKSGTSGALGKVQAKKGRRPARFKEKEFQIHLDTLRQNNKQDTELDLQNHYLDKWAAEDLAEVLMENRTVHTLNLSHNLIGDEGTTVSPPRYLLFVSSLLIT